MKSYSCRTVNFGEAPRDTLAWGHSQVSPASPLCPDVAALLVRNACWQGRILSQQDRQTDKTESEVQDAQPHGLTSRLCPPNPAKSVTTHQQRGRNGCSFFSHQRPAPGTQGAIPPNTYGAHHGVIQPFGQHSAPGQSGLLPDTPSQKSKRRKVFAT